MSDHRQDANGKRHRKPSINAILRSNAQWQRQRGIHLTEAEAAEIVDEAAAEVRRDNHCDSGEK